MKKVLTVMMLLTTTSTWAEDYKVASPDGTIVLNVSNGKTLTYEVKKNDLTMVAPSPMGFEFVGEKPMKGEFDCIEKAEPKSGVEEWNPVVKAKHAHVRIPYTSLTLKLKEKKGDACRMDVEFRVMDEGVAFRYTLYGGKRFDYRRIMKELTGFAVPSQSNAWMSDYRRPYSSSQESEFYKTPVTQQTDTLVKGLPYLIEVDKSNYMAILEADMNEWPGFYIGRELLVAIHICPERSSSISDTDRPASPSARVSCRIFEAFTTNGIMASINVSITCVVFLGFISFGVTIIVKLGQRYIKKTIFQRKNAKTLSILLTLFVFNIDLIVRLFRLWGLED